MGNQALIRGAELTAPKFNDIGAAVKAGTKDFVQVYEALANEKKQEERNQKARVETYLNNMPANVELGKIPVAQQGMVATWSKDLKMKYAEAARILPSLEPGSEEAIDARNVMDGVRQAFTNANNNFGTFKANKTEYLKNSNGNHLSKGNNSKEGNLLANIYTEGSDMALDEDGNLGFKSGDGDILNLNDVPDYFNKDLITAGALSKLNEDIYNSGEKLDKAMFNSHKQKILLMIKKGGRETVLSMATDNVIQEGGLGIVDQDLLYNPARQDDLTNFVVESYMDILNNSANIGFQKKEKAAAKLANSKNQSNKRQNVYGQNIDNELEIYGGDAQRVYSDITSSLSELDKADIKENDPNGNRLKQKADAINRILLTVNKNASQLAVDKDNVIYIDEGEDKKGGDPGIDFQNKASIADYILEQLADEGSMNPDTIRLIRNKLLSIEPQKPSKNVDINNIV